MGVSRKYEEDIATEVNDEGLKSDHVLAPLGPDLTTGNVWVWCKIPSDEGERMRWA